LNEPGLKEEQKQERVKVGDERGKAFIIIVGLG
jgi:hypothetical protein